MSHSELVHTQKGEHSYLSLSLGLLVQHHMQETPHPRLYLFQERKVLQGFPHPAAENHHFAMGAPARSQS